jgi:hypothetical protein
MSHRAFFERWFRELWAERNPGIIDECVEENCEIVGLPKTQWGRASFHGFFKMVGDAYPSIEIRVDECLSEGESYAIRCSGQVRCYQGKLHPITGAGMGKIRNGQMIQAFNQWGFHDVLESTGHIKPGILVETWEAEGRKAAKP